MAGLVGEFVSFADALTKAWGIAADAPLPKAIRLTSSAEAPHVRVHPDRSERARLLTTAELLRIKEFEKKKEQRKEQAKAKKAQKLAEEALTNSGALLGEEAAMLQ